MRQTYKTLESKLKYTDLDGTSKMLTAADVNKVFFNHFTIKKTSSNTFGDRAEIKMKKRKNNAMQQKMLQLLFDPVYLSIISSENNKEQTYHIKYKNLNKIDDNEKFQDLKKNITDNCKPNALNLIEEYEKSKAEYESAEQAQKEFKTIQAQNKNQTLFQYIRNDMFSNSKPKT